MTPMLSAAFLALFAALPKLSPKEFAITSFESAYRFVQITVIGLLTAITLLEVAAAIYPGLPLDDVGRICRLIREHFGKDSG